MRKLFLDDERVPGDVTWISLHDGPYDIVRSYDAFVAYVEEHGVADVISFDNDLGLNRAKLAEARAMAQDIANALDIEDTERAKEIIARMTSHMPEVVEREGRDCAKWLVESILDGKIEHNPNLVYTVHSKNTVAGPWIKQYLDQFMDFMKSA